MQEQPLKDIVLAACAGDEAACGEIVRRFTDNAHARAYAEF